LTLVLTLSALGLLTWLDAVFVFFWFFVMATSS